MTKRERELVGALKRAVAIIGELNGGIPASPCSDCKTERRMFGRGEKCSPHSIQAVQRELWKIADKTA